VKAERAIENGNDRSYQQLPGVGKLTIARELLELIGGRLLHNHTLYNVALALTERKSDEYFQAVRAVQSIAFDLVLVACGDQVIQNSRNRGFWYEHSG
jgi:hypothetical protein